MNTPAQDLLLDAAVNLTKARHWLDPKIRDRDHGAEQALKLMSDARLIIESVEITIGVNQAVREESLREGTR